MLLSRLAMLAARLFALALACCVSACNPLLHPANRVAAESGVTSIAFFGLATIALGSQGVIHVV